MIAYTIKKGLEKIEHKTAKKTSVFITADHGQIKINPNETIYLNSYGRLGKVYPTGGPRDVFIHTRHHKKEETIAYLKDKLKDFAKVIPTEKAFNKGFFGRGIPNKNLNDRIGDILILPKDNNTLWYEYQKGHKILSNGYHGGMTEEEMYVPFIASKLSDLKK